LVSLDFSVKQQIDQSIETLLDCLGGEMVSMLSSSGRDGESYSSWVIPIITFEFVAYPLSTQL